MDGLKKAYYRTFQFCLNIGARFLYWRKPVPVSGAHSIKEIPRLLKENGACRPMLVTDTFLFEHMAPSIMEIMDEAGVKYSTFGEVTPNPTVALVNKIYDKYLAEGCDSLIALGGGSAMDAAKGAGARVAKHGRDIGSMAGLFKVGRSLPTFIAIPTTAGTGSETTIAAVITDGETHHKYSVMDLHLVPKYAIFDPELTVGLPPFVTATTGMDALTHAIEAYICWTYNTKESLKDAEDATAIIFKYLEVAYNDPTNLEAREQMLIAANKAGFAFTRAGVGNVHAIAHTLGGLYNTAHGLANATILPIVLEEYGEKVYAKLARLAVFAGIAAEGAGDEANAKKLIAEIRAMNKRMGIPTGFDNIKREDVPQMCKWAMHEANPIYPVPVIFMEKEFTKAINRIIAEA